MEHNTQSEFIAHTRRKDNTTQSIIDHLECVASKASSYTAKIGMPLFGELIGLCHDLGKYSSEFQDYIRNGGERGSVDHSTTGAQFIWSLTPNCDDHLSVLVKEFLALIIASHHSGLIDCISPDGLDKFTERLGKSIARTSLLDEESFVRNKIRELISSQEFNKETDKLFELIKSDINQPIFRAGLLVKFLFSALIDADRTDTSNFTDASLSEYRGGYSEWGLLIDRLENHLSQLPVRNKVDEIRHRISNECATASERERGLYQLTVPTGGGKTLGAMRFALRHAKKWGMDRIIYIAPYISIVGQNFDAVSSILQASSDDPLILEHHSNLLLEKDTEWNRILSENWDVQVIFTTAVQFLETLFGGGTKSVRRMHQLANSVIILDEVQSIPIRVIHMFNNAINFLTEVCGSTVVFCTATQPLFDKVNKEKGAARFSPDSSIIDDVKGLFEELKRVKIIDCRKIGGWTDEEITDLTNREMASTGSCLVIVNTKKEAKEIYLRCRSNADNVFYLSTNMCAEHRNDCLNEIKKLLTSDIPVICISTQLIEAGVDVDFGTVIRSMAGMDSIVQAAGRCNRGGLRENGNTYIVNPLNENLRSLQEIKEAKESAERILEETSKGLDKDLLNPDIMARYYHYHFFEKASVMDYPVQAGNKIDRNDSLLSLLSNNNNSVEAYKRQNKIKPNIPLRQSFKTVGELFRVIKNDTTAVIVPYGDKGRDIINNLLITTDVKNQKNLLRSAQRYTVTLFQNDFDRLKMSGVLHEVWTESELYWLDVSHYDDDIGFIISGKNDMDILIG